MEVSGKVGRKNKKGHFISDCNVHHLLSCVVFSGLLRNSSSAKSALRMAMQAALPEALRKAVDDFMCSAHVIPSRSTLYRHRSTLIMALSRLLQQSNSASLNGSGMIKWFFLDSSPQGHLDWLLSASLTLPLSEARRCFLLCRDLECMSELEVEQAKKTQDVLAPFLLPKPGPPVAVGSGRAGRAHKVHAFVHSAKLESRTWGECCHMLSSVASFTTDQGTESIITSAKTWKLCSLFPWLAAPDTKDTFDIMSAKAPCGPQRVQACANASDFDFISADAPVLPSATSGATGGLTSPSHTKSRAKTNRHLCSN